MLTTHSLTLREVLLVGEDEYDGVPHLAVVDDPVQLLPRLVDAVAVRAVHHEDQPLRPRVVVPPQRPDLVLPSHVLQCNGYLQGYSSGQRQIVLIRRFHSSTDVNWGLSCKENDVRFSCSVVCAVYLFFGSSTT